MSKPQLTIQVYDSSRYSSDPAVQEKPAYRWNIVHRNGRIMADSGEGYRRKRDCLKAIATLKAGFAKAEVKEME